MPKDVKDHVLEHISFKETSPEFQEEVNDLHAWVHLVSSVE
jgi:hypothetical protein